MLDPSKSTVSIAVAQARVELEVQRKVQRYFGDFFVSWTGLGKCPVLIEHHPNIGDIISKKYLKVMFKVYKMGHLSNPNESRCSRRWVRKLNTRNSQNLDDSDQWTKKKRIKRPLASGRRVWIFVATRSPSGMVDEESLVWMDFAGSAFANFYFCLFLP